MRGRAEPVSLPRNDSDNIAAAQFRFDLGDLTFWNFIERPRRHIRFHARKRPEQRAIRGKITILAPANAHLARRMRDASPAKLTRHVVNQTAAIDLVCRLLLEKKQSQTTHTFSQAWSPARRTLSRTR